MRTPATQGSATPASRAAGRRDAKRQQMLRHADERLMSLRVAATPLWDPRPGRRLKLDTRWIARPIRMHPLALGRGGPGTQGPRPPCHSTPPAPAFGHQRACIFGHGPAKVHQKGVMGVLAGGLIENMDLAARALELFQEPQLMHIVASQALGTHQQHTAAGAFPELVPQAIEPRAMAWGTPRAIVADDLLTAPLLAFPLEMGSEPLELVVDGVGQGLAVGRPPDIEGWGHDFPPRGDEGAGGEGAWRTARSVGPMAGEAGRLDPTAVPRRPTPETVDVCATDVS